MAASPKAVREALIPSQGLWIRMKRKIRELILDVLWDGEPKHPHGVYMEIKEKYQRKLTYGSCRRVLRELLEEGKIRRLSGREVEDLGLQVTPSPSGRSGWRPPIPRSYYQIK